MISPVKIRSETAVHLTGKIGKTWFKIVAEEEANPGRAQGITVEKINQMGINLPNLRQPTKTDSP